MSDKLLVVLAGLLDLECENDRLLAPVGSLHEVVDLQASRHLAVRVADEEVLGLVPCRVSLAVELNVRDLHHVGRWLMPMIPATPMIPK